MTQATAIEAIARSVNAEDGAEFFTRLSADLRSALLHHLAGLAGSIAKDAEHAFAQLRGDA